MKLDNHRGGTLESSCYRPSAESAVRAALWLLPLSTLLLGVLGGIYLIESASQIGLTSKTEILHALFFPYIPQEF